MLEMTTHKFFSHTTRIFFDHKLEVDYIREGQNMKYLTGYRSKLEKIKNSFLECPKDENKAV